MGSFSDLFGSYDRHVLPPISFVVRYSPGISAPVYSVPRWCFPPPSFVLAGIDLLKEKGPPVCPKRWHARGAAARTPDFATLGPSWSTSCLGRTLLLELGSPALVFPPGHDAPLREPASAPAVDVPLVGHLA